MFIQSFPSGPFSTNAYIVASPATGDAALIDPAPGSADQLCKALEENKFTPKAIWLTHSHWDHIADVAALKRKFNIPVSIHPLDAPNLIHPGADQLPCWMQIEGVTPDNLLQEGETLTLGNIRFNVIHTPGHSPGSICLYCQEANILISGDTLFKGTIGNITFPTSQPALMWQSLKKLAILPASTKVYPGHGASTTIGREGWLARAEEQFG